MLNVLIILLQIGLTVCNFKVGEINEYFQDLCNNVEDNPILGYTKDDFLDEGSAGTVYLKNEGEVLKECSIPVHDYDTLSRIRTEMTVLSKEHNFYDVMKSSPDNCEYYYEIQAESEENGPAQMADENTQQIKKLTVYLTMPKFGKSLFYVLSEGMECTEQIMWAIDMMLKMTIAVGNLHSLGFIHRDIKFENFLLIENVESVESFVFTPVLIDFDISALKNTAAGNSHGTPFYKPKEASPYTEMQPSYDVFSLGKLFYYLLNTNLVELTKEDHPDVINCKAKFNLVDEDGNEVTFHLLYCYYFENLILSMTKESAEQRISIAEVKEALINIRKDVDELITDQRKILEDEIEQAKAILENDPNNEDAQDQVEENEEELEGLPITFQMYVARMKEEIDRLYPDHYHPIRMNFEQMYGEAMVLI